jgi:enamine deaminase RidA (YjgF/YER057c/UK114 family)
MDRIETKLRIMGLELPATRPPEANYLSTKRACNTLYVSARTSERRGAVGEDVTVEDARLAARDTLLEILSAVKTDIGELERIGSIDKVTGFVRSSPDFTDQPEVVDGASDLLVALWGENGRHVRTATSVAQLPDGASVQLEMILRLRH